LRFPKLKSDVAFDPNQPKSLLEILHSGGQTGVERAALDAAAFFQFPCGGWCPKGRKNDDGIIPRKFKLKETESEENLEQTEFNVRDSDASLILSYGDSSELLASVEKFSKKYQKEVLTMDLEFRPDPKKIVSWVIDKQLKSLNITGPRSKEVPKGEKIAFLFLVSILTSIQK